MDIRVDELIVEEDRPAHITKHNATIDEVREVIEGDYVFIQGKHERWILIGLTKKRRELKFTQGGDENENNKD